MQNEKTLVFWDDFYRTQQRNANSTATPPNATNPSPLSSSSSNTTLLATNNKKEWILEPSDALLRKILISAGLLVDDDDDDHTNNTTLATPSSADAAVTADCSSLATAAVADDGVDSMDDTARQKQQQHQQVCNNANTTTSNNNSSMASPPLRVLEIGCGTSSLSAALCAYWDQQCQQQQSHRYKQRQPQNVLHVLATDVSQVCIQQQKEDLERQQQQQLADGVNNGVTKWTVLDYQVLNITDTNDASLLLDQAFDLILDKGCLDTCLFRSKQPAVWLDAVVARLHSWLKRPTGVYIILTPRSKLKAVQQQRNGDLFHAIRHVLPAADYAMADLEPRQQQQQKHQNQKRQSSSPTTNNGDSEGNAPQPAATRRQFMYVCRPTDHPDVVHQSAGSHFSTTTAGSPPILPPQPSSGEGNSSSNDELCPTCGISLAAFRQSLPQWRDRSEEYWMRIWRGHQVHC